jgi:hypothetical protein
VYQEEVATSRVFLRETTAVPEVAILLFGGTLSVDHGAGTVCVATGLAPLTGAAGGAGVGALKFRAAPETGVLFKLLRRELDRLLAEAAADPSAAAATLGGSGGAGGRLRDVLLRLLPGSAADSVRV